MADLNDDATNPTAATAAETPLGPSRAVADANLAAWAEGVQRSVGEAMAPGLNSLSAELDRLRTALRFYADPATWEESRPRPGYLDGTVPAWSDRGDCARAALSGPAPVPPGTARMVGTWSHGRGMPPLKAGEMLPEDVRRAEARKAAGTED